MSSGTAIGSVLLTGVLLTGWAATPAAQAPPAADQETEYLVLPVQLEAPPAFMEEYSLGRKGFFRRTERGHMLRFVWQGESVDRWTEGLEVRSTWRADMPDTPVQAYRDAMQARLQACPETTGRVISRDAGSILYEISTVNCAGQADEQSLTRVLYGAREVFSLVYSHRAPAPPADRDEWLKVLAAARVDHENP